MVIKQLFPGITMCIVAVFAAICIAPVHLQAQSDYVNIQTRSTYTGSWTTRQAKLVGLLPGFNATSNGDDDFNRYGSNKHMKTDSTGFYYVKKIDGRWWLIDPDGYAGINMAVTSFTSDNIQHDYDVIKKSGYNGTGNFLGSESQTKSGYNIQNHHKFSFTRRLNFFLSYKNVRKNYYETPVAIQGSLDHVLVLDPQFELFCDNLASTNVTPFATERDLLGWFTDNEINFNQDQLRNLVRDLPAGDPSRNAALAFAASKGLTENDCINYTSNVTETIKREFATLLADHYFKTVAAAIRKYDSNHLILGSRFHGRPRAIQGVVDASHQYMDVTSVNFYDNYAPDNQITQSSWTKDKPCLVGEFYIKDINAFTVSQPGAGWYVNSQADRGKFYQNTCLELLKSNCYIGWHYFRFMDDSDSNKGIVSASRVEYQDMTAYMGELNKQVYRICDYYDGQTRRPQLGEKTETVVVAEDTYVIPGSTNTLNFGSETELEVVYHATEANRREIFLKFDVSAFKNNMPFLKNAELIVSVTQTDGLNRAVFASGLEDVNWQENTLNGMLRHNNSDWKNGYNRLSFQKGIINAGEIRFNITNWISQYGYQDVVAVKLHDLLANASPLKIASREHPNQSLKPRIVLAFWDESSLYQENTTVFLDNFNRTTLSPGGTPQLVYTISNTGSGTSAYIENENRLRLSGASQSAPTGVQGRHFVSAPLSGYGAPFNQVLSGNLSDSLVWTFNVRYNYKGALSGFNDGNRGFAIVLAASSADLSTASGYAVVNGGENPGVPRYRLVRFNGGLINNDNISNIVNGQLLSGDVPLGDDPRFYMSIKVKYQPKSGLWSFYERKDGLSAWADPTNATGYELSGAAIDNTYTGMQMNSFGYTQTYPASTVSFVVIYDNYKLVVSSAKTTYTNEVRSLPLIIKPVSGGFEITTEQADVKVFDTAGNIHQHKTIQGSETLLMRTPGVYLVRVQTIEGVRVVKQIVR